MAAEIKNIIFDMGGVLIKFDRDLFISRMGITDPADRELLMREVYISVEWAMMDRGTLDDKQAAEIMCARTPKRLHDAIRNMVGLWDRPILEIDGMYDVIEQLKKEGYKIYLLSNASVRQHDYWPRIPASKFFDGTFVSADYLMVKPERQIYEKALEVYGIKAEESFFIDDAPMNIEAANCVGIRGAVFHNDIEELKRKLRAEGVRI